MTSKQEAIISGEQIKNMLLGAYKSFEKNYQYINDLNVFPVPDGDTGTNMMHTMAAVAREISQLQNATVSEVGTMVAVAAWPGKRPGRQKTSYQQRGGQSFSVWYFVCLPGGIKAC